MQLSSCSRPRRASQLLACSLALSVVALGAPTTLVQAQVASAESTGSAYERAFAAYLEADFAGARRFLEQAQQDTSTSTQELAQAYALLGLLMEIEGGARAEVEAQMDYAVSVDLDVPLPEGASRTFRQLFEQVRAARRADAPRLEIEITQEGAREALARVMNVPEELITQVQLECEGSSGAVNARGRLEASLELASEPRVCSAEARNAQGHVLFRATREFGSRNLDAPNATASGDDTLWIVLGVVGGVILIGGAVTIGIIASTPRDAILGTPTVTGWSR